MKVDGFADEIVKALKQYSEDVEVKVKDAISDGSNKILKDLKKHPVIPKRTGKYKKSFCLKKTAEGEGYIRYRLWNKRYQLTHLLEYGHITRNGTSRTKAYPHWKDAQMQAEELVEKVKKELEE